ncbi:MAG TPA: magnesium transporter [Vicinamibacterales bacterium]
MTHVRRDVPIVLAASALLSFTSASRAAALALPELAFAAFFAGGVLKDTAGNAGPWIVFVATVIGLAVRRLDLESWTLFIPGGLTGRVDRAFGPRAATAATGIVIIERVLLTALACVVFGHYVAAWLFAATGYSRFLRNATAADLSTLTALVLLGWLWLRARRGHLLTPADRARHVWLAIGILAVLLVWAGATAIVRSALPAAPLPVPGMPEGAAGGWRDALTSAGWILIATLAALGRAAPAIGVADSIPRVVHELAPPRIAGLRRTAIITSTAALLLTGGLALLGAALVPAGADPRWASAPLAGLTQFLAPSWIHAPMAVAIVVAAGLMLGQTTRAGIWGAESALVRLAQRGTISDRLKLQHPRFGTFASAVDTAVLASALAIVVSGAGVTWLACAYATAVLWTLALQAAALTRLSERKGRIGVRLMTGLFGCAAVAMLLHADAGAVGASATMLSAAALLALRAKPAEEAPPDADASALLASSQVCGADLTASPGSVLVPVRNPHLLAHLMAALRTPPEHEIVVMTVRPLGADAIEEAESTQPSEAERLVFSRVLALAERYGRHVRLVIVPARDVFDAVMSMVIRLQASEVYVGESATISGDEQARLLGEAWERAGTPDLQVRLAVFHRSGRSDIYHLGPHAPELGVRDYDLIHRIWRDAVKDVGPHLHHHHVVRAALTTMAEQLNGPNRDEALQAIRAVARPADELAAVLRSRDYPRLRDMVRNRPPSDLGALLADLSLEDQAVVFRLLPRKDAAATFEYLEQDAREALLKTLSKEDVAALLNDMAPDDRTMFLEELPATATRELLALLTPNERAIAVTLLGYPEKSVGRLMTPDYVAVREDWTIQQVLDYVRAHGQDSETLNVIYVIDPHGVLIDDIRIREFLLTDPARRVADLMDRRFVALKATDDQQTAVAAFRQHDRSALPVTDTAGVLIGIVTVDDVLDVAETEATKDIQRIGGSEALDEPYMEIGFAKMIQKRAGWLTALFLGEMLTATAMGFFEAEISKAVVLALFIPLIISSGGNSGSQASTLVIRALALGELTLKDWWRVIRREVAAGLALGTILATIGFLRITLWSAFSDQYGQHWLLIAVTVAFTLVGIVLWGTLIGSLLPLILRRLGFDPATSSAPFVATLVDVTGLVIYFSVALVVLHGTLL